MHLCVMYLSVIRYVIVNCIFSLAAVFLLSLLISTVSIQVFVLAAKIKIPKNTYFVRYRIPNYPVIICFFTTDMLVDTSSEHSYDMYTFNDNNVHILFCTQQ